MLRLLVNNIDQSSKFQFGGAKRLQSLFFDLFLPNPERLRTLSSTSSEERTVIEDKVVLSTDSLTVFHLNGTVRSTQDEAKRLLRLHSKRSNSRFVAVIANSQTRGRGTNGRRWKTCQGNLFLTFAIPGDIIVSSKLTLLPIGVGTRVAAWISKFSRMRPLLKWPNDVLLSDRKVAGILVENYQTNSEHWWWLVGIGINIESSPKDLTMEATDHPSVCTRQATCLRDISTNSQLPTALDAGLSLASDLSSLVSEELSSKESSSLVDEWESYMISGQKFQIRETGELVTAKRLNKDGCLQVIGDDGESRLLLSDYLS